eukprot:1146156-Pelagomonas_calceolata.AAC.5
MLKASEQAWWLNDCKDQALRGSILTVKYSLPQLMGKNENWMTITPFRLETFGSNRKGKGYISFTCLRGQHS